MMGPVLKIDPIGVIETPFRDPRAHPSSLHGQTERAEQSASNRAFRLA
jgi:hypothetical protein